MKKIFGILVIFASFVFGADVTELQKACEGGDNRACIRFVSFNKDKKVNLAILQNSCDNNYLQACDWLGNYYKEGISVKKDDKKAFMLYKQACNGGNDEGCGSFHGFMIKLRWCGEVPHHRIVLLCVYFIITLTPSTMFTPLVGCDWRTPVRV